jgi:hypothetical protein
VAERFAHRLYRIIVGALERDAFDHTGRTIPVGETVNPSTFRFSSYSGAVSERLVDVIHHDSYTWSLMASGNKAR